MSFIQEVLVPNIGEFEGVEVIEVLVKSGDSVSIEDPLITMESDKASMDVPSPFKGKVKDVVIKAGDKISENDIILTLLLEESAIDASKKIDKPVDSPKIINDIEIETKAEDHKIDENISKIQSSKPPEINDKIEHKMFLKAHASPSVRKFSRELGVDLSKLSGTGRKGCSRCRKHLLWFLQRNSLKVV